MSDNKEINENSLAILFLTEMMLIEAEEILRNQELKNTSLTLSDWVFRKKMGEAVMRHARCYALEAERKMGEILKELEAKGELKHGKKRMCRVAGGQKSP